MQYFRILLAALLFFAVATNAQTQQQTVSLQGRVTSSKQTVLDRATIKVNNTVVSSSADGSYSIEGLSKREATVQVSAVGYQPFTRRISLTPGVNTLNIVLEEDAKSIEEVQVLGLTEAQEVNRQAYNVTAIDASKLYNTTLDIAGALDRVAGVRVRETGGLGSNMNLSLNGFSGNHIRFFIDGVPMDNMGSSFQINNIPINIADRVEVYKGVVPIWLGSDALGGAINIVTGNRHRNYVDASYSYGSFNTHRTVINTAVTSKSGLTLQLNAFQNYSDNNYKVHLEAYENRGGNYAESAKIPRFHDTYHNETLITNLGVVGKSFADQLLLGMVLGQNYKEFQTGARMQSVYGGRHRRGTTVMPTFKYSKKDLIEGLDVTLNANINLGWEQTIDTVNKRFDWFGVTTVLPSTSGEYRRSMYKYNNNEGSVTSTFNYALNNHHNFSLSNVFTSFNRKGSDELDPVNAQYELPSKTQKNVLGIGYQYQIEDSWSLTTFGKYIAQINTIGDRGRSEMHNWGYGFASTYFVNNGVQLKASYELTNRMPTPIEYFGDLDNQAPNPDLTPERSNNLNVGMIYSFQLQPDHHFVLNSNLIYRYAHDFIYTRFENNQQRLVADNREGVRTFGADADLRYSYKDWLTAGGSLTYQYLQNMQQIEPGFNGVSPVYLDQMPNIPYFFGNTDVSLFFRNIGRPHNNLNIGYNLLYVHQFWLYWPSRGGKAASDEKKFVPRQLSHDINLVYSLNNGKYNIGLEARNITDALLVDNFSLQKPGRAFYLNLRYFFNKKS